MSTLQPYTPTFNTNIKISANGGALSLDGGLPLVKEFMTKTNFMNYFIKLSSLTMTANVWSIRVHPSLNKHFSNKLRATIQMMPLIRLLITNYLSKSFISRGLLLNQRCLVCFKR